VSEFSLEERAALVAAAAEVATSGLVLGSSGNLSVRHAEMMLITPRGGNLADLAPEDCVAIDIRDGTVHPGHGANSASRPSSESTLHRNVYAVSGASAVVHTHAHYCTVLSTLVEELPAIHYAITSFGGPVRVAAYATFGTEALAASVSTALAGRTAALMANHGAVVAGRDLKHAVTLALQLEWVASVYYHAICAGTPKLLTEHQLDSVVTHARQLRYGLSEPGA
jgi:L-fuculose-phosphate aldolase